MYDEESNYCETLITPMIPRSVHVASVAYVVLTVLCVIAALLVTWWALIIAVLSLVLRWKTLQLTTTEYEYQFWGRQLDVEAIERNDKRRPLATFRLDDVECMAREDAPEIRAYRSVLGGERTAYMDLTDRNPLGMPVYLMFVRDDVLREVRLQPSREMLRKMWQAAPGAIHIPEELQAEAAEEV
ncbi:MAG: hypothetical protein LUC30_00345 [Clostridiales bacterium]|nr:hypothetical protein [Clostridiales bacterium]